ncbi:hypothetical protein PILCRDRAFT_258172 [Piloderma croceum F 1598]|uniref:Uncharacterized protein n=1 Tax=Piloderma croceum (strain F 1598) TaxID=765440 RepID=A0A0C3CFH7_PILCF|nr:hypothetical protein PILCRDRAFT_258172 [Piloderma croceum F 1598]
MVPENSNKGEVPFRNDRIHTKYTKFIPYEALKYPKIARLAGPHYGELGYYSYLSSLKDQNLSVYSRV